MKKITPILLMLLLAYTNSFCQVTRSMLQGKWFVLSSPKINITFNSDGTFVFNDYNSKKGASEQLTGNFIINGGKLLLNYSDRKGQTFNLTCPTEAAQASDIFISKGKFYRFVKALNDDMARPIPAYIVGYWFTPHAAIVNVIFRSDGTFLFNDYDHNTGSIINREGTYTFANNHITLHYSGGALSLNSEYDLYDINFRKGEDYYFVRADDYARIEGAQGCKVLGRLNHFGDDENCVYDACLKEPSDAKEPLYLVIFKDGKIICKKSIGSYGNVEVGNFTVLKEDDRDAFSISIRKQGKGNPWFQTLSFRLRKGSLQPIKEK